MDPCTSRTALPKYGPSSYSVTPNRKPARAYWRCSRRANAAAVTMITTLTGVSQAGRRPRWAAGAPPWDPSAEVLASVSLTAGFSLDLLALCIRRQPVRRRRTPGGARRVRGRRPPPGPQRMVPARTGEPADCRVTCRSRLVERIHRLGRWPAPPHFRRGLARVRYGHCGITLAGCRARSYPAGRRAGGQGAGQPPKRGSPVSSVIVLPFGAWPVGL